MAMNGFRGSTQAERTRRDLLRRLAEFVPEVEEEVDFALGGPFLKTSDVALLFGVSERCIRKWADGGKLQCLRTPGGQRLFPANVVAETLRDAAAWGRAPGIAAAAADDEIIKANEQITRLPSTNYGSNGHSTDGSKGRSTDGSRVSAGKTSTESGR